MPLEVGPLWLAWGRRGHRAGRELSTVLGTTSDFWLQAAVK